MGEGLQGGEGEVQVGLGVGVVETVQGGFWPRDGLAVAVGAGQRERGHLRCESGLTWTQREGVRGRRKGHCREDREPLRIHRAKLWSASSQERAEFAAQRVDGRLQPEAGFRVEMETTAPLGASWGLPVTGRATERDKLEQSQKGDWGSSSLVIHMFLDREK